nr:MAG: replication associated protein [Cressdnaviricota sp.]
MSDDDSTSESTSIVSSAPSKRKRAPKRYQTRAYNWTFNNYPEELYGTPPSWHQEGDFSCYSKEEGEKDGTPHLQGFTYFAKKVTIGGIRKLFDEFWEAHFSNEEIKSISGAINYTKGLCDKKGNVFNETWVSFGEPPQQNSDECANYETAYSAAKQGRFEEIPAHERVKFWFQWNAIHKAAKVITYPMAPLESRKDCGIWFWGPTHCGKSYTVDTDPQFASQFLLPRTHKGGTIWLIGYEGEEWIRLEDPVIDDANTYMGWIKETMDRMPRKFRTGMQSYVLCRPKLVVTSNFSIEQMFGSGVDGKAILQRFTQIEKNVPYEP